MAKSKTPPKVGSKILVNVILDRSGSMDSIRDATISGYNEYLRGLLADKDTEYSISLTQFDAPLANAELTISYVDRPLADVPTLSRETYQPRGNTPLYDAIGETVRRVDPIINGRPVLCVIITDGLENASREFTKESVKKLIQEKSANGWTFTFLGADIDSYAVGGGMGTQTMNTSNYNKQNIVRAFMATAEATRGYATNRQSTGTHGQNSGEAFYTNSQKSAMEAAPEPAPEPDEPKKPRDWKVTKTDVE